MKKIIIDRITKIILIFVILLSFVGCAQMGKYSISKPPVQDTKYFKNVEVSKIEVGLTTDEIDNDTTYELRSAIIESIQKKNIYQQVLNELDNDEDALKIECKIIELDNGDQFIRWLLGMGIGKAHLDVSCKFINKKTNQVFASGTFTGEISGGIFGGEADQKLMSKFVAEAIARFLKKGE